MKKTTGELAAFLGATLAGNPDVVITGIKAIEEAGPGDITFIANPKYMRFLETTKASAVIVSPEVDDPSKTLIKIDNPYLAFANTVTLFAAAERDYFGVSPEAFVHPEAHVEPECAVYPFVYVGRGARVKKHAVLYPGVYLGDEAEVGEQTILYPNVTVMDRCVIKDRVIIHAGTVIGADGFGFAHEGPKQVKIPQIGIVVIEQDVEIGSNCSIDRAALGTTWIKRGVKMDNLIQIGHNVVVEEDSILVAQAGISGSTHIGKNVILAGQAGLVGHLTIGDGAIVTAKTGVYKDIAPGEVMSGYPMMPHRKWLRAMPVVARLPELKKEVDALKKRIAELEKQGEGGAKEER
jgi:UDP-3-O-[3-hydroxymyristoyl] glucosamine N-acyltransferase